MDLEHEMPPPPNSYLAALSSILYSGVVKDNGKFDKLGIFTIVNTSTVVLDETKIWTPRLMPLDPNLWLVESLTRHKLIMRARNQEDNSITSLSLHSMWVVDQIVMQGNELADILFKRLLTRRLVGNLRGVQIDINTGVGVVMVK